jgi:amino acid adenylation domain-containing protein
MLIGILGILKAGSAYVPLDPSYPAERLEFMLADGEVSVLLTQKSLDLRLDNRRLRRVYLDSEAAIMEQKGREDFASGARPEDLAYVIYTSGSTGQPKGVMVEHKSVVNYLFWCEEVLFSECVHTVPHVSSISFDASLKQILAPLICGRSVWILPPETLTEPALLVRTLSKRKNLGFNCVPSLWNTLLDTIAPDEAKILGQSLSALYLGGEQPAKPLVQKTLTMFPSLQIWNLYGPTEATANCLAGRILSAGEISLGRPIANAQVYVLDKKLDPVPVGAPGEICVGGVGVSRGYLRRPALTAERFIANPFSQRPGATLYRTGDIARYRADGDIEFLGRIDNQVKIRGFRIELGEIEHLLAQHPAVKQNVVVAKEDGAGEKHLVAYIVFESRTNRVGVEDLHGFLKERAPEYMIPSVFEQLDSLPLTPAGKLNRSALPEPHPHRLTLSREYVAPRFAVEETLERIWREILGIERVGIQSNFFELGGHSLLAMRMMGRIRSALNVDMSLRNFFDDPTIESLSKAIEHAPKFSPAVLVPRDASAIFPMSFSQQRLWFLQQLAPHAPAYNVYRALRLGGPINVSELERSFNDLAQRHESLRTAFRIIAGEPVQVIESEVNISLPLVDLRHLPGAERIQEAQRLGAQEILRPFELSDVPLFRLSLYRLEEEDHILLIVMHQIATDWWSMSVLFHEIGTLYNGYGSGPEVLLPPLPLQYADLTLLQFQQAQSDKLQKDLAYWTNQLSGPLPILRLPQDHARPAIKTYRGARTRFQVSDAVAAKLNAISREQGATLFMTLLAAFNVLLYRLTREQEILVGSPVAIRDRAETDQIIGFLINEVVLRTDLSGNPTFKTILIRVRNLVLDAFTHVGLPFQKLVQALSPARESSRSLLFQASFVLQNAPDSPLCLDGVIALPISIDAGTSQLDLELEMVERPEGLCGTFIYDRDLFEPATVERWQSEFVALLETVTSNREQRLSDLSAANAVGAMEDSYALTPLQESMLFNHFYSPAAGVDIEQLVVYLPEPLDTSAFKSAWQAVIDHNPLLRTCFCWDNDAEPYQNISRQAAMPWDECDEREAALAGRALSLKRFLQGDRRRGLNLSQAPLMRGTLLRFDDEEFYFIWTFHHAVLDGRSFPMVLNDVFSLYEADKAGREIALSRRPLYRAFVVWHGQQNWSRAAEHWLRTMRGFRAPTSLVAAVHPEKQISAGALHGEEECELSGELSGKLAALMKDHEVTLNTIMQAAWALLLHKYTGDETVLFGAVKAGRYGTIQGAESMLGSLINAVPVRVEVQQDLLVVDWLKKLREERLARRQFDQTPYPKIREWSEIPGDTPLFESLLLVETHPLESLLSHESRGKRRTFKLWEQTACPVTVAAYGGATIRLAVEYDTSLFESETIQRMLGHLTKLLEGIAGHKEQPVKCLQLLTGEELCQIRSWHGRQDAGMQQSCLHELFEARACCAPDSVAIEYEGGGLTYRELNEQANQLAMHLRSSGVSGESPVGIHLERSASMIVALLAVLKAGGTYLPLDPQYPEERLLYMVRKLNVRFLLTQSAILERRSHFIGEFIKAREKQKVICMDNDWGGISSQDGENIDSGAKQDDLAYIIFTSGSTGEPKGVEIPHKAVVNHCLQTGHEYELRDGDKVLQFASLNFDVAAEEIFPTLVAGATITVPGDATLGSPDAFQQFLEEKRVSVVNLPVSYWHTWFSDRLKRGFKLPSTVRLVVVGSEKVSAEQHRLWQEYTHAQARLCNAYGTTETTITTTVFRPEQHAWHQETAALPIGRAMPNTRAYLLSRQLEPVPIGVLGEIVIGGAGLARGYRDTPELTAEKFVADLFSADPGARMYRTGDLGRYRPDGNIEYCGRRDSQIKLRGYRIEPGEIETWLVRNPSVREAAVIAENSTSGETQLVAYVVSNRAAASVGDLRSFLKQQLPEYMVPSRIVFLDALPFQPNGKLDRNALLGKEQSGDDLQTTFVAPRNAVEEEIARIWTEILGLEEVGIRDDFFELGGHSLLATQVFSRILKVYDVALTLRMLFEKPTIEELAMEIITHLLTETETHPNRAS